MASVYEVGQCKGVDGSGAVTHVSKINFRLIW